MKCSQCGAINQAESNFCSYCSTPFPKQQQAPQQQGYQPPTVIVYNQISNAATATANASATIAAVVPRRRSWLERLVWKFVCGFFVLLLLSGVINYCASFNEKNKSAADFRGFALGMMIVFGCLSLWSWRKTR